MSFQEMITETAETLNISENDAMVLEFINMGTWANMAGHVKGQAIAHVAAKHAAGHIDKATKDQLLGMLN